MAGSVASGNGAGAAPVSSSSVNRPSTRDAASILNAQKPPIWEWEGSELDDWMLKTLQDASLKVASAALAKKNAMNILHPGSTTSGGIEPVATPASDEMIHYWYERIQTSINSVHVVEYDTQPENHNEDDEEVYERPAKRRRKRQKLEDPYLVWWISKYTQKPEKKRDNEDEDDQDEANDLPITLGARLAQLSPGGWFNAMACVEGGIVRKAQPVLAIVQDNAAKYAGVLIVPDSTKTYEQYVTELWETASAVSRLVQAAIERDIWRTTPYRIQQRLAPDLSAQEFASIRKRVYETVILGKGLHVNDEDERDELPVASKSAEHDVEKYKKCSGCGNIDQSSFALDRKNGDIICSNCGVVVSESLMHEGSAYRKFEGELDRNHHGDAPNALYSNSHNLSTSLAGVAPTTGAGIGGWGSGRGGGNLETILRNTHAYTELNVSQYGKTERRTREGYKDRQKKEAFVQMTHTGDALNLHEAVVQRAKELFAGFREDRELLQQFKGVLAACLCEAFEQLAAQGKDGFLVKGVGSAAISTAEEKAAESVDGANEEVDADETAKLTGRAARRSELHRATLAGRGGLMLDFTNVLSSQIKKEDPSDPVHGKVAASWDLEDCRSWLLEASRRIAQQWVKERQEAPPAERHKWPNGPLEEIEGQLVEHSIVLCEHLEQELHSRNATTSAVTTKKVSTPRIQDMSKLGIKWQRAGGRGPGVNGGRGGNDPRQMTKVAGGAQKTAGQILLLKTATKLSSVLKDPAAGEAFHRELRVVVRRQEAQKQKMQLEEASRQRFQQMQRKPWLQARAQVGS